MRSQRWGTFLLALRNTSKLKMSPELLLIAHEAGAQIRGTEGTVRSPQEGFKSGGRSCQQDDSKSHKTSWWEEQPHSIQNPSGSGVWRHQGPGFHQASKTTATQSKGSKSRRVLCLPRWHETPHCRLSFPPEATSRTSEPRISLRVHPCVIILSALYSLEKNLGSGGGVTNFRDQTRTCTGLMHVISQLISLISRLILGYSRPMLATKSWVLSFCQSSQLIILIVD